MKHRSAKVCYLFREKSNLYKPFRKVTDHCYYTEKYCGTAHLCDLKFREHGCIHILVYNSSRFDNHLILTKTAENLKSVSFYVLIKTLQGLSFFAHEKV